MKIFQRYIRGKTGHAYTFSEGPIAFPDPIDRPEKFRYFCMGKALVVGLITEMGKRLNIIFKKEPETVKADEKEREAM